MLDLRNGKPFSPSTTHDKLPYLLGQIGATFRYSSWMLNPFSLMNCILHFLQIKCLLCWVHKYRRTVVSVPCGPSALAVKEAAWGLARYAAISQVHDCAFSVGPS